MGVPAPRAAICMAGPANRLPPQKTLDRAGLAAQVLEADAFALLARKAPPFRQNSFGTQTYVEGAGGINMSNWSYTLA